MATTPHVPRPFAAARQIAPTGRRLTMLTYLGVALIALLPRVLDLGGFVTIDEINAWLPRSERFLAALAAGDFGATAQSAHPGVTTMWLGAGGLLLHRLLDGWGLIDPADFATRLALLQLPLALANTAAVLVGYALLRRLLAAPVALIAAVLWACDPFVVGFSRLLHVDGLMTSFSAISVLAACAYWLRPEVSGRTSDARAIWLLLLSGACAGLAVLSKSPAAVLAPTVAGIAALAAWNDSRARRAEPSATGESDRRPPSHAAEAPPGPRAWERGPGGAGQGAPPGVTGRPAANPAEQPEPFSAPAGIRAGGERKSAPWRRALIALLIWGAAAALTALLAWPAIWADPARAIDRLTAGVTEEGGEPHQSGNFFLGQVVEAPGLAYYPVAMALRLTPWGLIGLALLAIFWRRVAPAQRPALAAMAWFVLLLTLELSLFPKKFDRYLVPAFPGLAVLAAAGWWAVAAGWRGRPVRPARPGSRIGRARSLYRLPFAFCLLIALAVGNVAWWHPYGLIAYNQLLGGTPRAAQMVRMGWGEGMRQVADWLNRQPDRAEVATASTTVATLRPYLAPGVGAELPPRSGDLPEQVGYAVVYLRSLQDGNLGAALGRLVAYERPVYTVLLKGVPYAQIYQVPPAPDLERTASFGDSIALRGYELRSSGGDTLDLTLFWRTEMIPPNVSLFAHLIDETGRKASQIDLPALTAGWEGSRYYRTSLTLPLPDGLPPGEYDLLIGFYQPDTFQRLSLGAGQAADPRIDGQDALLLRRFALPMR